PVSCISPFFLSLSWLFNSMQFLSILQKPSALHSYTKPLAYNSLSLISPQTRRESSTTSAASPVLIASRRSTLQTAAARTFAPSPPTRKAIQSLSLCLCSGFSLLVTPTLFFIIFVSRDLPPSHCFAYSLSPLCRSRDQDGPVCEWSERSRCRRCILFILIFSA